MKQIGRTFITGDIHSTYDIKKIKEFKKDFKYSNLTKTDVLIIAGDFGFLWNYKRTKHEAYWLKWLDDCPWTTCFVDGNHENHDLLDRLQKRDLFGAEVGIVAHSIHHLLRGNVYKINNKRILTVGGANSQDRDRRKWGESMWKQEVITDADIDFAFKNLAIYHDKVDIVVSHAAPTKFAKQAIPLSFAPFWIPDQSEEQLQRLLDSGFIFKKWFFGHYHLSSKDSYNENWQCVYNDIIEI